MQAKSFTQVSLFKETLYNSFMPAGGRPPQSERNQLGERIATARERAGISQYDLAKRLGVTQGTVVTWERRVSQIKSDTLIKLATALNVTTDELLGLKPPSENPLRGRCAKIFHNVSTLPRRQQERILDQVEDTIYGMERRQKIAS